MNFTQFMGDASVEQNSLGCCCFTRVYMSRDTDVPHFL
jgi:hypothetical protein